MVCEISEGPSSELLCSLRRVSRCKLKKKKKNTLVCDVYERPCSDSVHCAGSGLATRWLMLVWRRLERDSVMPDQDEMCGDRSLFRLLENQSQRSDQQVLFPQTSITNSVALGQVSEMNTCVCSLFRIALSSCSRCIV